MFTYKLSEGTIETFFPFDSYHSCVEPTSKHEGKLQPI